MSESVSEIRDENEKDYPAITVRVFKDDKGERDDKINNLVHHYVQNWQTKTQTYCRRMGIKAMIPDFFNSINESCPKWSNREIEKINSFITKYKIIPSIGYPNGGYLPEDFLEFTKQVWWLVPFVVWKEEYASWIFIDKNGFFAPHPEHNDGILVFPWDKIKDFDLVWVEDNLVTLTLTDKNSDGHLSFSEFVDEKNGSYLSVIESIYNVYKKTIDVSDNVWYHGAGGEGYKGFNTIEELLDENIWKSVKATDPRIYGYVLPKPTEVQSLIDSIKNSIEIDKEDLLEIWKKSLSIINWNADFKEFYNLFFKQKYFEHAVDPKHLAFEASALDFYKNLPKNLFGSTYYISLNKSVGYEHLQGLSEVTNKYALDKELKNKIGNLFNIFKNVLQHPNYFERYSFESKNYKTDYEDSWLKFLAVYENDFPINFVSHDNFGLRDIYAVTCVWKSADLAKSVLMNPNCPSYVIPKIFEIFSEDKEIVELINNHPNYKNDLGKAKWKQKKALIWDQNINAWIENGEELKMSESVSEIRDEIDREWLSKYLGENFAEELEFTDFNIQILKISMNDLKSEFYDNIQHIGYVKNEDWDTLRTLVNEKEVKAIQKEFDEDIKRYKDEYEGDLSKEDIRFNLYKAILYCNEEYVWSTTHYSFDD